VLSKEMGLMAYLKFWMIKLWFAVDGGGNAVILRDACWYWGLMS
jgi:hypothetical protein